MPITASRQPSAASPAPPRGRWRGRPRARRRPGRPAPPPSRAARPPPGRRSGPARRCRAARAGRRPAARRTPCARRAAAAPTAATSSSRRSPAVRPRRGGRPSSSGSGWPTRWSPRATEDRGRPAAGPDPVLGGAGRRRARHAVLAVVVEPAQRLHQPDQAEQGQVGVGDRAQRVDDAVAEDVVERVDQPGQRRVVQQLVGARRRRRTPAAPAGQPGSSVAREEEVTGSTYRGRRRAGSEPRQVAVAARTGSPGCGSPPTPPACCAGRSRRRARRGCRRPAREPSISEIASLRVDGQRLDAHRPALAVGQRPDVVLGLRRAARSPPRCP